MRIFITGASGFIGRNVVELLSLGSNKLLLLAKDKSDRRLLDNYKQNVIIGDFKNIVNFKNDIKNFNPQVFVHLAWEGIPDFSFDMCKRNLDNSLAIVNFIINDTDCKKIIISGSCLEYGKINGVCKESDEVNINSFFSWAKYSLYCYLRFICKKLDKDLIWFRIFYAYGPGQRKESLIPSLIYSLKNGVKPNIDNALNANDFIHVRDIAQALRKAINKDIKSGIYNLGSGKSTRVIDICKIAERIINGKVSISNTVNLNRNPRETINFWADTSKTDAIFGWRAKTDIETGIRQYFKTLEAKG